MRKLLSLTLVSAVCSWTSGCKDDDAAPAPPATANATDPAAETAVPPPPETVDPPVAETNDAAPPDPQGEFDAEAKLLFRVAACAGDAEVPARLRGVVEPHCAKLQAHNARYQEKWLEPMRAFMEQLVPEDVPGRVFYPFGGQDLVSALVAFPEASEITIVSLEKAADPRAVNKLDAAALAESLAASREHLKFLMDVAFHRTEALEQMAEDPLPEQLVGALWALAVHGREPVSLRFFRMQADGTLEYVTDDFDDFELTFRKPGGPLQTYRHMAADLSDGAMKKNTGLTAYIEQRRPMAGIIKASSFLLWRTYFSRVRDLILDNTTWIVADATAPLPRHARAKGFEQIPYGRFTGPEVAFQEGDEVTLSEPFIELWKTRGKGAVPVRWGYLDAKRQKHLLVMKKVE